MEHAGRRRSILGSIALTLFGVLLGASLNDWIVEKKNALIDRVWECDVNSERGFLALGAASEAGRNGNSSDAQQLYEEAAASFIRASICTTPTGLRSAAQLAELYCAQVVYIADPQLEASKRLRRASDNAGAAMYDIQVAVQRCEAFGWGRTDYLPD